MDTTISLGPLLIPGTVFIIAGALLAGRLVLRKYAAEDADTVRWIVDRSTTALVVAFLLWKLWPLTTWWEEIAEDPVILLRLPGGPAGVLVGTIAGVAVLVPGLIRSSERRLPFGAGLLGAVVGGALTIAILGAVGDGSPRNVSESGADLSVELFGPENHEGESGSEAGPARTAALLSETRPTVITFWATWCGPCRAELPVKKRFYEEHASRTDRSAEFVAVNMTNTESSTAAVARYLEEHAIGYPVGLDRNGVLADRFSVRGTPTTIVVAPNGTILDRWTGPSSLQRLVRSIR
ncbi:MAG: TlpA family protein disulfide reductase [Alkalispirochaeta sp.]